MKVILFQLFIKTNSEKLPGALVSILWNRLHQLLAGIIAGWSFGLAGFIFQTMLRNPLVQVLIKGVTKVLSIAAVFCILVYKTNSLTTEIISIKLGL